jgi:hypothetical protein
MLLADNGSSGGLGFLILVIFIVVAVVIFIGMSRSMRRMRGHVDRGDFGLPPDDPRRDAPPPPGTGPKP